MHIIFIIYPSSPILSPSDDSTILGHLMRSPYPTDKDRVADISIFMFAGRLNLYLIPCYFCIFCVCLIYFLNLTTRICRARHDGISTQFADGSTSAQSSRGGEASRGIGQSVCWHRGALQVHPHTTIPAHVSLYGHQRGHETWPCRCWRTQQDVETKGNWHCTTDEAKLSTFLHFYYYPLYTSLHLHRFNMENTPFLLAVS